MTRERPDNAIAPRTDLAAGLGATMAVTLAAPAVVGAFLLAVRAPGPMQGIWVALALVGFWRWHRDRFAARQELGWTLAIALGAMAFSACWFDLTFDGQTYHQLAVRELAGGWNPVWHPGAVARLPGGVYLESLPKAAWIVEAMLYHATGALESAKAVQWVACIAASLLAWAAIRTAGHSARRAVIIAVLAAANPVVVTQLLSFQVDGLVASGLTILLSATYLSWRTDDPQWAVVLVAMVAFVANLKFPAVLSVAIIAIASLATVGRYDRRRLRRLVLVFGGGAITALASGINPYITNALRHGHPAYPALGPEAVPLVVHFDSGFTARSRVAQFGLALAAESSDQDDQAPRLKVPFSVRSRELAAFTSADTRIGGLGPWFGGALLLGAVTIVLAIRDRTPGAAAAGLAMALALLSALAIPHGYYSRYAPQLWLAAFPAMLLPRPSRLGERSLLLALGINASLVTVVSMATQLFTERMHRAQLHELARAAPQGALTVTWYEAAFSNVDLHFAAYGLHHRVVSAPTCDRPARLLKTHALICLPAHVSPAPTPDVLHAAQGLLASLRGP